MSREVPRGAVVFENVTKEYRLGRPRAFLAAALPFGDGVGRGDRLKALDDVSFAIEPGESFALIGANGAGKSTALKCLAGVTRTTRGSVSKGGRVVALIELGIGFHPDLSGLENAKFAATIAGLRGTAAKELVERAIDFAEIERFATTPVKRYSSGMYARLSFGIAANLPADILIVDEILAVGDLAFQRKCYAHLAALRRNAGATLMFVSHNDWVLKETCERGALLVNGQLKQIGRVSDLLTAYHATSVSAGAQAVERSAGQHVSFGDVDLVGDAGPREVTVHGRLDLTIELSVQPGVTRAVIGVAVFNKDRQLVWAVYSDEHGVDLPPGEHRVTLSVDDYPLVPGPGVIEVFGFDRASPVVETSRLLDVTVLGDDDVGETRWEHGLVDVPTQWAVDPG